MPQMAPLNWLSLFIFFGTCLMLFNLNNFFSMKANPKHQMLSKNLIKLSWKW